MAVAAAPRPPCAIFRGQLRTCSSAAAGAGAQPDGESGGAGTAPHLHEAQPYPGVYVVRTVAQAEHACRVLREHSHREPEGVHAWDTETVRAQQPVICTL